MKSTIALLALNLCIGSVTAGAAVCNLAQVDTGWDAPSMYMKGFQTSFEAESLEVCTGKAQSLLGTVFRCRSHRRSRLRPHFRDCHTDAVRYNFVNNGFSVKGTVKKVK